MSTVQATGLLKDYLSSRRLRHIEPSVNSRPAAVRDLASAGDFGSVYGWLAMWWAIAPISM